MTTIKSLEQLARTVRALILLSTTEAGSGHPTSSLSATDLMTALLFGGSFRFHPDQPDYPNKDRLIFSKGHASPLLYALWTVAGTVTVEDLMGLRKFGSPLEGHPTMAFPYAEAATGSLGQGLSVGLGMALNARYIDGLPYRTYVLLGDSEMAEGSQWEALQIAAHYGLDNLVAVLDVNRLGQRGETMYGHDLGAYTRRVGAFGWETFAVDGHSLEEIMEAYRKASEIKGRPSMIIARTLKGKGVSFLEDRNGWHGKALSREECDRALKELGEFSLDLRGPIEKPASVQITQRPPGRSRDLFYDPGKPVATRRAYGNALTRLFECFPSIVALDAEVSNSTYAEIFKAAHQERFFEMYVAEQNMVGAALGLSRRGKIPFVSTFAAFLTRAFDQIRMSQYSEANIKFVGSHAGVSIGEDGASQMGLEDIAMFRTLMNSAVLYPSDAVSTERLVEAAATYRGIVYIRTTRAETPILYAADEQFPIGGCKVLRRSGRDRATIVAAGITLHEALAASEALEAEGNPVRVIDLYSLKPVDTEALREAAQQTGIIITVEDHFPEGGIGEAVCSALSMTRARVHCMAVRRMPRSGKPRELLRFEEISREDILRKVKEVI
jgi:transketolase